MVFKIILIGLIRAGKSTVERLLAEPEETVIDLGGGHSVYDDESLFVRVKKALSPFPNVFLIMPSPDLAESIAVLNERTGGFVSNDYDFHENFVGSRCNYELAKHTIYTKGKTPLETCGEIAELIVYK